MGLEVIQAAVLAAGERLKGEFASAQPFRHVVIDSFLEPRFCNDLQVEFPPFEAGQSANEMGVAGGKAVRPDLPKIGPGYARLDEVFQSAEFLAWLGEVTGIPELLYDPEYVGGGTHENRHGQDLDMHVDFNYHPKTRFHRRLNLILFLNRDWDPEWGGVLELRKDPTLPSGRDVVSAVTPLANGCVIFETTEASWHGFRRIELPEELRFMTRRSIAVYFYTKSRAGAAPSHGTVYVPGPMPEFVKVGRTLTAEDVWELEVQFTRNQTQIQYLYHRELEFSRIAGSASFRLARALSWPFRAVRRMLGAESGGG